MLANRLANFRGKTLYVCKALLPFPGVCCTPVPVASCAASVWSLAAYVRPPRDWWLDSGADTGSSPLSVGSLPTHVRAPSASFLRHSCQVSQNNDYLSPETNFHPDTFPSWRLAAWLPRRGLSPTTQSCCETSFLHVCKTCQEANMKAQGESCARSSFFFLWSLLANNYSHATCPACTANVVASPRGRTAELEAVARTARWGFSIFKVVNSNLRGLERAWRPWQLLRRELQVHYVCNPLLRGLRVTKFFLGWKGFPLTANNSFQWSEMIIEIHFSSLYIFNALFWSIGITCLGRSFLMYIFRLDCQVILDTPITVDQPCLPLPQKRGRKTVVSKHCSSSWLQSYTIAL